MFGKICLIASEEVTLRIIEVYSCVALWDQSLPFAEVRQIISRYCKKPILYENVPNKFN